MPFSDDLRIGCVFIVLATSALGVFLPLGRYVQNGVLLSLIKAFGAGTIIAVAFVHALGESVLLLESTGVDFPLAAASALAAFLLMLFTETEMKAFLTPHEMSAPRQVVPDQSSDDVEKNAKATASTSAAEHTSPGKEKRYLVLLLEAGIIAHSVAIGITLGLNSASDQALPLLVAICFHQFFEGIGLGSVLLDAGMPRAEAWLSAIVFLVTAPIGVAVGLGLSVRIGLDEEAPEYQWTVGVITSFSAGLLLYFAIVGMLLPEFIKPSLRGLNSLRRGMYLATALGALGITILALWA